jgi:putative ABC transport system permease protein
MVRSFIGLINVDQGYRVDNAITMQLTLPPARYKTDAEIANFYTTLVDRVRELPGVMSAGVTSSAPPAWNDNSTRFILEGEPAPQRGDPAHQERLRVVSDGYFNTIGIPLKLGRDFDRRDGHDALPVIVVSEAFAKKYWPGENPIGKRISPLGSPPIISTVIGVVGDARHNPNVGRPPLAPVLYIAAAQGAWRTMTLVARANGDPTGLTPEIQRTIGKIDPALAAGDVVTLTRMLDGGLAPQRITAWMLSIFAAIAVLLAVIGIYGVMSYNVTQRTHEIGIRMALGAQQGDVVRRIMRQGFGLAATGVAIGSAGSWALTRQMTGLLDWVRGLDALTFASVAAALGLIAMVGSWVPARRAASVDPVVALRDS